MRRWLPGIFVIIAFIASVVVFPRVPNPSPIHWDSQGRPNGYGNPVLALFLLPAIMLLMWGVFHLIPKIDPRAENYAKFRGSYDLVIVAVMAMMTAIHLTIIAALLGHPAWGPRVVPVAAGLLIVVIGNVLPRARPNWFFGIRTPWTLSSDRVWEKTHRVGGLIMVICGLVIMTAAWLPSRLMGPAIGGVAFLAAMSTIAYSYVVWKQEGTTD